MRTDQRCTSNLMLRVPNDRLPMLQALLVVMLKHLPLLRIYALRLERASTLDVRIDPAMLGEPLPGSVPIWRFVRLCEKQNAVVL